MRTKRCPDCRRTLPLEEFPRNRSAKDGVQGYCKPCYNKRIRGYKEKSHGSERNFLLKHRYGIMEERLQELLWKQTGLCAICDRRQASHVDHDHKSGKVRGLLCFKCNEGLGKAFDDPEILRSALGYLEHHGSA